MSCILLFFSNNNKVLNPNYMSGTAKPPEVFDTLYDVFSCTAYLVTPLDLVTVF